MLRGASKVSTSSQLDGKHPLNPGLFIALRFELFGRFSAIEENNAQWNRHLNLLQYFLTIEIVGFLISQMRDSTIEC